MQGAVRDETIEGKKKSHKLRRCGHWEQRRTEPRQTVLSREGEMVGSPTMWVRAEM